MELNELTTKIKAGKLGGIFFFYGEEQYVLTSKLNDMIKKTVPTGTEAFNLSKLEGKNVSAADIIALVDQFPQLSETKMIIARETGLLNNATLTDFKLIKKMAENFPSDTCLVFVENTFDDKKVKNLGFIEKSGGVVKFNQTPVNQLELWIEKYFKKIEKRISDRDARYIIRLCGQSSGKIVQACQKLDSYTTGRNEITQNDIDTVIEKSADYKIYEFADSIIQKNRIAVYEHLSHLKSAKETKNRPNYVLGKVIDKMSELLMCKLLSAEGLSANEIINYYDRRPMAFVVTKSIRESKKLDEKALKKLIDRGVYYDYMSKCGKLNAWVAVDMYVAEILS